MEGDDLGPAFSWPFHAPGAWPRILAMGALAMLLLVTLVGAVPAAVALNGWMLEASDAHRAGAPRVPPAGLYWRRGWRPFAAQAIWLLILTALEITLVIGGLAVARAGGAAAVGGGLAALLGNGLGLVGGLAVAAAAPAQATLADRAGVAAALDPRRVLAVYRRTDGPVLVSLLAILALDVVAPVGALACLVGLLLSLPYAYLVLAAAAARCQVPAKGAGLD